MEKASEALYVSYPGDFVSPLTPNSKEELLRDGYVQDTRTTYDRIVKANQATQVCVCVCVYVWVCGCVYVCV